MPCLTCVHTLDNNTSMNIKTNGENTQYYICKLPVYQHRH